MKFKIKPGKNTGRTLKQCAAALLTAVLLTAMCTTALAADVIDPDQTGSISITMQTSDGETVGGGTLALYQVAQVCVDETGQNSYKLTDEFANSGADLSDLSASTLADTLSSYVESSDPAVYGTANIGEDGCAVFEALELGVYFVLQTEAAAGCYAVSPFIVTVPMDVNGILVYDVDASPKVEAAVEVPDEQPTPTPTTTTEELLPQTGAILWPMALMAALGLVLLFGGGVLVFCEKRGREKRSCV